MKMCKSIIQILIGIVFWTLPVMAAEVNVTKEGCGSGRVTGVDIDCGEYCTATYPDETILHLKAYPTDDSEFLGWLINGAPQEGAIVIREDTTVTAIFEKKLQQVQEFETIDVRPFKITDMEEEGLIFLLRDAQRVFVGTITRTQLDDGHIDQTISLNNGAHFRVESLDNILVSPDKNRVLVYGGYLDDLESASSDMVIIYSGTGELVARIETNIGWPNQFLPVVMEDTGGFLIAGRKWGIDDSFLLKKYSSNGEFLWEDALPKNPQALKVSLDNQRIALLFEEDFYTGFSEIRYYESDGTVQHDQELPSSFYGMEFVSNHNILLYSSDTWELYQFDHLDSPIASAKFKGTLAEIIPLSQTGNFLIKSFSQEPCEEGYHFQAVDAETGQIVAEKFFEMPPYKDVPFIRTTNRGTIELWHKTNIIELRIPE